MAQSILTSTKKVLGIDENYTVFDTDIIMHINSAFSTLQQLGIGPPNGFAIENAETMWDAFLGDDPRLNTVKSYVYLRVRLLFDPPGTSYLIAAINKQIEEMVWRMNVSRENSDYVDPFAEEDDEEAV